MRRSFLPAEPSENEKAPNLRVMALRQADRYHIPRHLSSKLGVEPRTKDGNRPAVAVVGRIHDKLIVERDTPER